MSDDLLRMCLVKKMKSNFWVLAPPFQLHVASREIQGWISHYKACSENTFTHWIISLVQQRWFKWLISIRKVLEFSNVFLIFICIVYPHCLWKEKAGIFITYLTFNKYILYKAVLDDIIEISTYLFCISLNLLL